MRKYLSLMMVCAGIIFSTLDAKAEVAGGIVLGNPAGLTLRIDDALVLGLGGWGYGMTVWGDHWIINRPIPTQSSLRLNWYLGVGGEIGFVDQGYWDHHYYYHGSYSGGSFLGVRIPIGLLIPFEQRWEVFFEIVPVMSLYPFYPAGNGGIGIRYTF